MLTSKIVMELLLKLSSSASAAAARDAICFQMCDDSLTRRHILLKALFIEFHSISVNQIQRDALYKSYFYPKLMSLCLALDWSQYRLG